jgi:hypothetical protein
MGAGDANRLVCPFSMTDLDIPEVTGKKAASSDSRNSQPINQSPEIP